MKFTNICPSCRSDQIQIEDDTNRWYKCLSCHSSFFVDKKQINSYFMQILYQNHWYCASFYLNPIATSPFILSWLVDGEYLNILQLPFLPNINLNNFLSKLKVLLIFQ